MCVCCVCGFVCVCVCVCVSHAHHTSSNKKQDIMCVYTHSHAHTHTQTHTRYQDHLLLVSKETYYSVKRDLPKRPTVSKETYAAHLTQILKRQCPSVFTVPRSPATSVKRDLLQCEKRPSTHTQTSVP